MNIKISSLSDIPVEDYRQAYLNGDIAFFEDGVTQDVAIIAFLKAEGLRPENIRQLNIMFLDLIGDQLKAAGWDYLYEWTSNDPTEFITPKDSSLAASP